MAQRSTRKDKADEAKAPEAQAEETKTEEAQAPEPQERSVDEASSAEELLILQEEGQDSEEPADDEPTPDADIPGSEDGGGKVEVLRDGLVVNGRFLVKGTVVKVPKETFSMTQKKQEEVYGDVYYRKA